MSVPFLTGQALVDNGVFTQAQWDAIVTQAGNEQITELQTSPTIDLRSQYVNQHPDHVGDTYQTSGTQLRGTMFPVETADIADAAVTNPKLADNAASNAKLADMAQNKIKLRASPTTGDPEDVAVSELPALAAVDDYRLLAQKEGGDLGSIRKADLPTGSGEANTAANVGTGAGSFRDKTGVTLNLRSFVSGDASVVITENADEIDLRATGAGGGEANRGQNLGTAAEVYAGMNGVNLQFRSFIGSGITVDQNVNDLTFTATAASVGADPAGSAAGVQSNLDTHEAETITTTAPHGLVNNGGGTQFLSDDGTYKTPPGGGDVTGPGSSVADNITVFADTSGKVIKDSLVGIASVSDHLGDTGNPHNTNVTNLTDTTITGPLQVGDILQWTGAAWVDRSLLEADIATGTALDAHTSDADDDHTQYHNDARGDARYYQQTEFTETSMSAAQPIILTSEGKIHPSLIGRRPAAGVRTSSFTAAKNSMYRIDLSGVSANVQVTPPAGVVDGDWFGFLVNDPHPTRDYSAHINPATPVNGSSGHDNIWSLWTHAEMLVFVFRSDDWHVEHDGRIAHVCTLTLTGGQTFFTSGSLESVDFNGKTYDPANIGDVTLNRIDTKRAGVYQANFFYDWQAAGVNTDRYAEIMAPTIGNLAANRFQAPTGLARDSIAGSTGQPLAAGSYFINAQQDSGGPLNLGFGTVCRFTVTEVLQ